MKFNGKISDKFLVLASVSEQIEHFITESESDLEYFEKKFTETGSKDYQSSIDYLKLKISVYKELLEKIQDM